MKNILICIEMEEKYKKLLLENCKDCNIDFILKKDLSVDILKKYDAIIGNAPFNLIKDLKNLKWLQTESAGVDAYKDLRRDITITNCTGAYGEAISEYIIAAIYMIYKKFDLYLKNQSKHLFENLGKVKQVKNSKVLVVGFGDIGETFAKKANLLGMEIHGVRNNKNKKPDYVKEMYGLDEIKAAVKDKDIIVCSLPSTSNTKGAFTYDVLKSMNKDSILINVGRGDLIKTIDLIKALEEDHFYKVYLDVTEIEPLPINSKLWNFENVIITPHITGNYNMDYTFDIVFDIVTKNINNYVNDKKLSNLVDLDLGYRKIEL